MFTKGPSIQHLGNWRWRNAIQNEKSFVQGEEGVTPHMYVRTYIYFHAFGIMFVLWYILDLLGVIPYIKSCAT